MSAIDVIAHEYGWPEAQILDLTIAKVRSFIEASQFRRRSEFRRTVALQEWSTRLIAQAALASGMNDTSKQQKEIAKQSFPWFEDREKQPDVTLTADDDLSFLETGDMSAADRNKGKQMPFAGI